MELKKSTLRKMLTEKYRGTANMTDPEEYQTLKDLLLESYKDGKVNPRATALLYGILGGKKLRQVFAFSSLILFVETYPQTLEGFLPQTAGEKEKALFNLLQEKNLRELLKDAISKDWQEELSVKDPEVKRLLYTGREYLKVLREMDFSQQELQKITEKMEETEEKAKTSGRDFFVNMEILRAVSEYYINKNLPALSSQVRTSGSDLKVLEAGIDGQELESLTALMERLKRRMGLQEEVRLRVVDLDEVNAYALYREGHEIWLTRRFVDAFREEKERAIIIAHELGHIKEKDAFLEPEQVGKLAHYIITGQAIQDHHALCKMSRTREYRADMHAVRAVAEEYRMSISDAMKLLYQTIKRMEALLPLSPQEKKVEECLYHDRNIFAPGG